MTALIITLIIIGLVVWHSVFNLREDAFFTSMMKEIFSSREAKKRGALVIAGIGYFGLIILCIYKIVTFYL